jgi:hypothetical protein
MLEAPTWSPLRGELPKAAVPGGAPPHALLKTCPCHSQQGPYISGTTQECAPPPHLSQNKRPSLLILTRDGFIFSFRSFTSWERNAGAAPGGCWKGAVPGAEGSRRKRAEANSPRFVSGFTPPGQAPRVQGATRRRGGRSPGSPGQAMRGRGPPTKPRAPPPMPRPRPLLRAREKTRAPRTVFWPA